MVQAAIKEAVGEYVFRLVYSFNLFMNYISDKIALNVNADEAAVLGKYLHSSSLEPK